jgi:hypothetical protein
MPIKIKSTSGSVTLDAHDVSGDNTLTIPNLSGSNSLISTGDTATVTEAMVHADAVNVFKSGRKNLIINGGMQVAQRGTSHTSTGYGSVDRWNTGWNAGSLTSSQGTLTSGAAYDAGFRKTFKLTNGSAQSNSTSYYVSCYYWIEAQDLSNSGWNYTDSSSYITISFWIKSSIAGTYNVNPTTQDGTKQIYPATFSLSANTWTKVEKSFPGHANLTFDDNAERGMQLHISPYYGTDFTTSSVSTSAWSGYAGGARFSDYAQQWGNNTGATWEITGVQLELGTTATDFEHRSYGEELALCQRYYQILNSEYVSGYYTGYMSDWIMERFQFPVVMRGSPTMSWRSGVVRFTYWQQNYFSDNITAASGWRGLNNSGVTLFMDHTGAQTPTTNEMYTGSGNTAYFGADAEL